MEPRPGSSAGRFAWLRNDYAGWVVGGISVAIIGGQGGPLTWTVATASAAIFTLDVLAYVGAIRAWGWPAEQGWTRGRTRIVRLAIVVGLGAFAAAALLIGMAVVRR